MPFLRRRGTGNATSDSNIQHHDELKVDKKSEDTNVIPIPVAIASTDEGESMATEADVNTGPKLAGRVVPAPPVTPPHDGSFPINDDISNIAQAIDRPDSPPPQDDVQKMKRFSMLRFRNASDSQLSARARKQAMSEDSAPPMPPPPEIITTAPTVDFKAAPKKTSRIFTRFRRSAEHTHGGSQHASSVDISKEDRRRTIFEPLGLPDKDSLEVEDVPRPKSSHLPGRHAQASSSNLALPRPRYSESSRSDASSGSHMPRPSQASGAHTISSGSFFRLGGRRSKAPEPLFPIAHLKHTSNLGSTASNASLPTSSPTVFDNGLPRSSIASSTASGHAPHASSGPSPAKALFSKGNPHASSTLFRRPSSKRSVHSSPGSSHAQLRGRSSTMSSMGQDSQDEKTAPPDGRQSTSTGRKSFGDLLGLGKLRVNSDVAGTRSACTPATPGSYASKNNSLQIQREAVVLPERLEDENPAKYLARAEETNPRNTIAAAVAAKSDPFSLNVLRSYMRKFALFGDPMDMAVRKLLMEADLPKETQHIDRFLEAFANRYDECNPGIYLVDQAYFVLFSIMILQTDAFNKNNKHKMTKSGYIKNTDDDTIFDDILEVFYDNITYTPFIRVSDEVDSNGTKSSSHKSRRKGLFPINDSHEAVLKRAAKEPLDPYTLIIEQKLDVLRPSLKDVMNMEDPYSTMGTGRGPNPKDLQQTFFRTGVLQIISARSRPDAFMAHVTNPQEAQPGLVDIKVTKIGILWRKDAKKKKARSPWQEWGAILTGAQLYFFRNTAWVRDLMHQYETHIKQGQDGIPIIFQPPLVQFKPDTLFSTEGAVALVDNTYKKHENAFSYIRQGGIEEVLLAEDEGEWNDWLAKLNYAATFRTAGVRMRGGVPAVTTAGQPRRAIQRLDTDEAQMAADGGDGTAKTKVDHQLAQEMTVARREVMFVRVTEANHKLEILEKKLDIQLRNARHLQILAPVQPKTRDQMLLSAARMAAQLKWTRIEIWKHQCHRDILLQDLEDERLSLGLPVVPNIQVPSRGRSSTLVRELSKATTTTAAVTAAAAAASPTASSPRNGRPSSMQPSFGAESEAQSPVTDVYQTPPTSAHPASHKHQNSWELPHLGFDEDKTRKESVSSAASGSQPPSTPLRSAKTALASTSINASARRASLDQMQAEDAGEQTLLEKTGLIATPLKNTPDASSSRADVSDRENIANGVERTMRSVSKEMSDKNKVRRSFHRTLRDGAGHISSVRGRKGRESISSHATDDNNNSARDAETLPRSSGSFVVHGKKASVINFGSDFHSMSHDERKAKRALLSGDYSFVGSDVVSNGDSDSIGPSTSDGARNGGGGGGNAASELHSRKRRGSAASVSTITAMSFRELHRKYSTAQQAAAAASAARMSSGARHFSGSLAVPGSDEDSDAAISFSESRRPSMPVIESGDTLDEADDGDGSAEEDGPENVDREEDEDEDQDLRDPARRTMFFTPEPHRAPGESDSDVDGDDDDENDGKDVHSGLSAKAAGKRPMHGGSSG